MGWNDFAKCFDMKLLLLRLSPLEQFQYRDYFWSNNGLKLDNPRSKTRFSRHLDPISGNQGGCVQVPLLIKFRLCYLKVAVG